MIEQLGKSSFTLFKYNPTFEILNIILQYLQQLPVHNCEQFITFQTLDSDALQNYSIYYVLKKPVKSESYRTCFSI